MGATGLALAGCGGAGITTISGPTTITIPDPKTGAIVRCKANGTRLRAEIPAPGGEVNKSIEGSTGESRSIDLVLRRRPDGSVVVSCKR